MVFQALAITAALILAFAGLVVLGHYYPVVLAALVVVTLFAGVFTSVLMELKSRVARS